MAPLSYKNIAAKPPATAAKLNVTVAPAALETVAGEEPVEELTPLVLVTEPDPVEVAVELALVVLLTTAGSMVALYEAQVELGARGQVSSMQMLWS
jgi:hypothetical protein